ncbi:MAG: sodium:calcium antiporter [Frankiales bacterium]|nr:sodium:calcium antiporter [Frankiales bacterium]
MTLLPNLPLLGSILVFLVCAAAIWVAGVFLSNYTDVLSDRLGLGSALGGLVLLAIATNLPEIAITVTAASNGQVDIAVSNILGGIALQTVVLVALDAAVQVRRPLTYQAASLTLVLEGAVVVAVLLACVMGAQLPHDAVAFRLSPDVIGIALLWGVGLLLTSRAARSLPWHDSGNAPDSQPEPRGHSAKKRADAAKDKGVSTARAVTVFGVAALVTLVGGALLEESGSQAAAHVGLSGVLFGATVLAAATALPELSTGITAVRSGDYQLAFGDIFGGNAFLPVLFLLATVISGKAILPNAHASDLYLTALGALLTVIYMAGLLFRPAKQHARLGVDSIVVLVVYAVGIVGLATLPT